MQALVGLREHIGPTGPHKNNRGLIPEFTNAASLLYALRSGLYAEEMETISNKAFPMLTPSAFQKIANRLEDLMLEEYNRTDWLRLPIHLKRELREVWDITMDEKDNEDLSDAAELKQADEEMSDEEEEIEVEDEEQF